MKLAYTVRIDKEHEIDVNIDDYFDLLHSGNVIRRFKVIDFDSRYDQIIVKTVYPCNEDNEIYRYYLQELIDEQYIHVPNCK